MSGRSRRRTWRRWVLRGVVATLLLLAVPVVLVGWYTRPKNLGPLVESVLSRQLGGELHVNRADLSWDGRLTLRGVWLDVPGMPPERDRFAKLFETPRLTVDFDFSGLWRGELRVQDLAADRPELHIIEDLDRGELNLEMLRVAEDEDGPGEPVELKLPPSIAIKGARVRFGQVSGGVFEALDKMRLEGELRERTDQAKAYDFELRQYDAEARVEATLSGSLDAKAPSLTLDVEGVRVDAAHRQLVPAGFRELWDQLRPTGKLPNLTVMMDAGDDGRLRLKEAVLELADVSITPPYAELGRPPIDDAEGRPYAPRMTEVGGRFVLRRDGLRVEDLTGIIEGVRYYAAGRWGFGPGAPGEISVSTDPFTLDEDPRFLASLPMVGVQIFERLRPSGRFQASTMFSRAQAGAKVEASGTVKLLGARGQYHKFPFPISDMRGVIRFDNDRVVIDGLTGDGPRGGTITIDGAIAPPADGASVRIAVAARGVPFDEHVLSAFSERRRKSVELFFAPEMHAALIEEGVIRPGPLPEAETENDGPPVFDLGGVIDLDVLIDRGLGHDADYAITTTIQAEGAQALFRYWPYPLVGESGQIVAGPDGIELRDVVVRGLSGGRGVLRGRLSQAERGGPAIPDIRIEEADLPVDDLLVHSIRAEQRSIVKDLHAEGRLTGGATVTRPDPRNDPEGDTQWLVDAAIASGSVRPYDGDYRIQQLAGGFQLGNHGLTLHDVTGRRGAASLRLNGRFDWGKDVESGFRLDAVGRDLAIEPALLDVLPPREPGREKLAGLIETYRPEGVADVELRWESLPEARDNITDTDARPGSTYTLAVEPARLSFDLRGDRLVFSETTGRAVVRPDHVEVESLGVVFDSGVSKLDGMVGLDGVTPTALSFTATADAHCPYTRKFLPEPVTAALDALRVTGDYRLTDARLLRRPQPEPGQTRVELDAKVRMIDTSLVLGVPITELNGELDVRVRDHADARRPRITLDVRANQLRAADRLVAPLNVTLDNTQDPDVLRFDPMLGGVYGGVLVGSGAVPLDGDGRYRFDLTLNDAAVDPFLKPAEHDPDHRAAPVVLTTVPNGPRSTSADPEAAAAPPPPSFSHLDRDPNAGRLSASLSVEAPLDDPDRRRGRGALRIVDARLFDRPLSNAVLRASNLSIPSGEPLNAANARYLIDGRTVRFDELSLAGPNLTIAGAGTMSLPDTKLNLVMVSRNTAVPRLGPVSDLIDLFKDELIAIRVTGTLARPQTGVTSLRGVQSGWQDLFGPTPAPGSTPANLAPEVNAIEP